MASGTLKDLGPYWADPKNHKWAQSQFANAVIVPDKRRSLVDTLKAGAPGQWLSWGSHSPRTIIVMPGHSESFSLVALYRAVNPVIERAVRDGLVYRGTFLGGYWERVERNPWSLVLDSVGASVNK